MKTLGLFALVVPISVVALGAQHADACGQWSLEDPHGGWSATFEWQYLSFRAAKTSRADLELQNGVPVRVLGSRDRPPRAVEIKGGLIVREGIEVGRATATFVVLGGKRFQIEIFDEPDPKSPLDFVVRVKREQQIVASGRAMSLLHSCDDAAEARRGLERDSRAQTDIRNRVILFLARHASDLPGS